MRERIILESPAVEIPWGIEEFGFVLLVGLKAQRITAGHFRLHCTFFGGFEHDVEFHFEPSVSGRLRQL